MNKSYDGKSHIHLKMIAVYKQCKQHTKDQLLLKKRTMTPQTNKILKNKFYQFVKPEMVIQSVTEVAKISSLLQIHYTDFSWQRWLAYH